MGLAVFSQARIRLLVKELIECVQKRLPTYFPIAENLIVVSLNEDGQSLNVDKELSTSVFRDLYRDSCLVVGIEYRIQVRGSRFSK